MLQSEFEKNRISQIRALFAMDKKQDMKVIELVELLLKQNPSLPIMIQVGTQKYSIDSVSVDNKHKVRITTTSKGRLL